MPNRIESRIDAAKFARILRQQLQARHPQGSAVRRLLDSMTDEEIITAYTDHPRIQARERAPKDEAQRRHRGAAHVRSVG